MSKLRPNLTNGEDTFKFSKWLDGEKDPFLGQVEMKPQIWVEETDKVKEERLLEQLKIRESIYDTKHNKELKWFGNIYKFLCIVCCVVLISLLMITVSYLPPTGEADKPDNNEVAARYIENGLQETGAVNIVTGMILDYRAFDTFGE